MEHELIEYIRAIRKIAQAQVGVHFGEKSPHHIREILRLCEAAEQKRAVDVANAWRCQCGFLVDGNLQTCDVCDTPRN